MSDLLKIAEAAAVLNVSITTLYNWHRAGKIEFLKVCGSSIRIRKAEIERLLNEATTTNNQPTHNIGD